MSTTGARLPMPHKGQRTVRTQARRFNWLAAGRRWRKTTLFVAIAVEAAAAGQHIIWGAPTFDQVRIGWGEMKHGVGANARFTQQRMTAEFPSGGRVIFRSLDDPNNARGHTADGAIIDEAEAVKPGAWYEVIRPMLIDTGGWAWAGGTPLGRNWFFSAHAGAMSQADAMHWQIPTKGCEIVDDGRRIVRKPHPLENPDIPFSEIEQIFATVPLRTFRQEILAEFIEGEGAVFRNIKANLYPGGDTPDDHEGHSIVMGVDWGKSNDYTAASVGCKTCKRELELDRYHGVEYRLQRARLAALAEKWGVWQILAESNSMGEPNIEQMIISGLPVTGFATTSASKPPLIENLALCLEREEVKFLDLAVPTAELEAYEMRVRSGPGSTNRPVYGAPEGVHDDTVIARALMCRAMELRGAWEQFLARDENDN